ncbi:MAG: VOC family protein [Polyangiaceae bacterium]|jgi:uncharacterized glyoxalase superfamily protein PhnB/DNA-binding XRE family transcriptional regulator
MEVRETGDRIRTLRERKAWTQQHLAEAARISPRTVQRAEEGVMSAETRAAIAGALDVPVESLATALKAPAGWPQITPTLLYEDSKTAVDWLEKAFGFIARLKVPGEHGQIVHSELTLGTGVIMVGSVSWSPSAGGRFVSPKSNGGKVTQSLFVFVDDLDAHYACAKAAGATIVQEIQSGYGFRRYRALDHEGHEWCFAVKAEA